MSEDAPSRLPKHRERLRLAEMLADYVMRGGKIRRFEFGSREGPREYKTPWNTSRKPEPQETEPPEIKTDDARDEYPDTDKGG